MAVSFSATVTKDGASIALNRLTGGGGGRGAASPSAGAVSGPNIVDDIGKGMVLNFLPRVFDTNMYGWTPVKRDGRQTPLLRSQRQVSRIRSAFFYSVAGSVATIKNIYKFAHIHDKGATIRAKNATYLRFKVGDRWASKKSVTIPQRRFAYWSEQARAFAVNRATLLIQQALRRSK